MRTVIQRIKDVILILPRTVSRLRLPQPASPAIPETTPAGLHMDLPAGPRIPVGMVCDGLERTPGDALPLADGGDRKQFHRFRDGFHHHERLPASVSCSQAWLPR